MDAATPTTRPEKRIPCCFAPASTFPSLRPAARAGIHPVRPRAPRAPRLAQCCATPPRSVRRRAALRVLGGCAAAHVLNALLAPSAAWAAVRLADPDAGQDVVRTASGLRFYDFTRGGGDVAVRAGDRVRFHLVLGTTGARNGWKIDSTYARDALVVTVGAGEVVPGLDEGLRGMLVGGRRRCLVPESIGYRDSSDRPVPPGFAEYQRFKNLYLNKDRPYKPDVVFDIEVLKITRAS